MNGKNSKAFYHHRLFVHKASGKKRNVYNFK